MVIERARRVELLQVPVPEQPPPDQPENVAPTLASAVAVSVT